LQLKDIKKKALCKINSHKASKILTDALRFPIMFYTENELQPARISDAINTFNSIQEKQIYLCAT